MNPEIKLKRLCQKGHAAQLIGKFIADRTRPLAIIDLNGACLLGDGNEGSRQPISVEGNHLGWVCGPPEDAGLLAAFISYMAQKELESKLLAQETLSKYKELTLLYELGEKIAACLDIDELAHLTLDEARSFLPSSQDIHLGILLAGQEDGQLTICAGQGELFPVGSQLASIDGITQQVLASGNTEIVNEVWQDPRYQACGGSLGNVQAMLCAPLKTRDKTFGVLSVVSRSSVYFSAAEAKVLNLLATQVALAIARVHLIHERVAQERLQESLKLSHSIQMGMLSTAFPRFSDGQPIDLFAVMEPAREV
ncbi:MAG: GAF domain-containing protein, partial [Methylovulum sp.]|nr:GAF domain-containing protein [Methylovulum sp.]